MEIFDLINSLNETYLLREQIRKRFLELFSADLPQIQGKLPPYTRKRERLHEAISNLAEDTYGTKEGPEVYREMLHEISNENEDLEGFFYNNLFYWVTKRKRPVF